VPTLHSEPAVINLTVRPGAVAHPNGDAVHFDVLHGAANEVIGRLRDVGLDQGGSIVLENVGDGVPDGHVIGWQVQLIGAGQRVIAGERVRESRDRLV
jgi:hypothetical protein